MAKVTDEGRARVAEYQDKFFPDAIMSDLGSTYKLISGHSYPVQALVRCVETKKVYHNGRQLRKPMQICKGSIIEHTDHFNKRVESNDKHYTKITQEFRSKLVLGKTTVDGKDYSVVLEDSEPMSQAAAITITTCTHADPKLIGPVNVKKLLERGGHKNV